MAGVRELIVQEGVASGIMTIQGKTWSVTTYYCPWCARHRNGASRDGEAICEHKEALFAALDRDYLDDQSMYRELAHGLG
jgi:hypothetical protein